jgi:hypothetical protein
MDFFRALGFGTLAVSSSPRLASRRLSLILCVYVYVYTVYLYIPPPELEP